MCSAMYHQPDYVVKKVLLFGTSLVHPETQWDAAKKYEISMLHFVIYFYHSPTKLQEGNVFSRVFLSVCLLTGGPMWSLPTIWTSP